MDYECVHVLDINSIERSFFTSHGMHLRMGGKRLLALHIIEVLFKTKSNMAPVPSSLLDISIDGGRTLAGVAGA
ncbi:hypothetical protein J6590_044646 [Homalodisca vitripennis]|nr:hypothetical protein J6590_044646 [Homalodisca vitripennis]